MIEFFNATLGIVVSILTLCGLCTGIALSVRKKTNQKSKGGSISNDSEGDATNVSNPTQKGVGENVNVIGNNNTIVKLAQGPFGGEQQNEIVDLKGICQILFIDDEPLPILIKTLKKTGWKSIKRIGDIANLDAPDIRNANIIFVDIKGVGKELMFKNEGVGLAAALKQKYPKKGVVIYSATSEHNLFDPDIDKVDGRLFKNAEPIQFSDMIEQYGKPKD